MVARGDDLVDQTDSGLIFDLRHHLGFAVFLRQ